MINGRRQRCLVFGAFILSATLTAPLSAVAMCMGPRTFLAPLSGTTLPENPSLYLFVPHYQTKPVVRAWTVHGEQPFEMTVMSKGPAHTSYQIDVFVDAGNALFVHIQDPKRETRFTESHFSVVKRKPVPEAPISIQSVEAEISRWTCSFQRSHNVRLSHAAPAFRVEWAASKTAYASGRTQTLVVPARMPSFFDQGVAGTATEATVELGHVNCFGHTLQWSGGEPLYVGITALYVNGTEQHVSEAPLSLRPPKRPPLQVLREDYVEPMLYMVAGYFALASTWLF